MTDEQDFTVATARQAAERDELAEWVRRFLASPGSDNAPLGEKLATQPLWWAGPVELPIDQLNRLAGPPGEPVIVQVDEEEWRDDVDENHRVEALRRAGRTSAWGVVGFPDRSGRDAFVPPGG